MHPTLKHDSCTTPLPHSNSRLKSYLTTLVNCPCHPLSSEYLTPWIYGRHNLHNEKGWWSEACACASAATPLLPPRVCAVRRIAKGLERVQGGPSSVLPPHTQFLQLPQTSPGRQFPYPFQVESPQRVLGRRDGTFTRRNARVSL